jgi:predicted MarR family transcription regulator
VSRDEHILLVLDGHPEAGLRMAQIRQALAQRRQQCSDQVVLRHLRELRRGDFVEKTGGGRSTAYRLTRRGRVWCEHAPGGRLDTAGAPCG